MTRPQFLTLVGFVALLIGGFALLAPQVLLVHVKHATPHPVGIAMARTVGVLLLAVGALNLLVRRHGDSPTMRAVLLVNLAIQLAILPLDPVAWWTGAFHGLDSFAPNTALHVVLAVGFARELSRAPTETAANRGFSALQG